MTGAAAAFVFSFLSLVAEKGLQISLQILRNWLNNQPLEVEEPSLEAIEALKDEVTPLGKYPGS